LKSAYEKSPGGSYPRSGVPNEKLDLLPRSTYKGSVSQRLNWEKLRRYKSEDRHSYSGLSIEMCEKYERILRDLPQSNFVKSLLDFLTTNQHLTERQMIAIKGLQANPALRRAAKDRQVV